MGVRSSSTGHQSSAEDGKLIIDARVPWCGVPASLSVLDADTCREFCSRADACGLPELDTLGGIPLGALDGGSALQSRLLAFFERRIRARVPCMRVRLCCDSKLHPRLLSSGFLQPTPRPNVMLATILRTLTTAI